MSIAVKKQPADANGKNVIIPTGDANVILNNYYGDKSFKTNGSPTWDEFAALKGPGPWVLPGNGEATDIDWK